MEIYSHIFDKFHSLKASCCEYAAEAYNTIPYRYISGSQKTVVDLMLHG